MEASTSERDSRMETISVLLRLIIFDILELKVAHAARSDPK
jgi:hypothetical protein